MASKKITENERTARMLEKVAFSLESFANELDKYNKPQIKTAEVSASYGHIDSRPSVGEDPIAAWLFSSSL